MKVVIVEDEKIAAEKLVRALLIIDKNIDVLTCIASVSEAKKWFAENTCDLVFLDIHLADGLSFDIFKESPLDIPVIFTTAYDEYALKAFKMNSIDYLLKPINKKDLAQALHKFKKLSTPQSIDYHALTNLLQNSIKSYKQAFIVQSNDKLLRIPVSTIAYFFAESKHVLLSDYSGKQHIIDGSLDTLQEQLDPQQFHRVNRKYLIHINSVCEVHSWPKSRLMLKLKPTVKENIVVSYERVKAFKDWLAHATAN